jgi:hypothetical protein
VIIKFLDSSTGCYKNGIVAIRPWAQIMKMTVEVSDELYRRAKAEATLRSRQLCDLVDEGLRLVLDAPPKSRCDLSPSELTKRSRGLVNSGVPDLASDPKHLVSLGRDGSA